ncbi:hypothetical protein EJ02DRAFT_468113 [Clathrospora elynae]|uniref:Uncharacterized protein n=1 Tax=Clathrospora elynae TaxID=706981 RepID=A0A6A5SIK4_9PLEO|nr:hypothetical protein EJ02DRAFT_468113 [Clathrospora elynae]
MQWYHAPNEEWLTVFDATFDKTLIDMACSTAYFRLSMRNYNGYPSEAERNSLATQALSYEDTEYRICWEFEEITFVEQVDAHPDDMSDHTMRVDFGNNSPAAPYINNSEFPDLKIQKSWKPIRYFSTILVQYATCSSETATLLTGHPQGPCYTIPLRSTSEKNVTVQFS